MKTCGIVLSAVICLCLSQGALAAEATQLYRIRKGDGLDAIARAHHTSRATLLRLNALQMPNTLDVGSVIVVPRAKSQPVGRASTTVHRRIHRVAAPITVARRVTAAKPSAVRMGAAAGKATVVPGVKPAAMPRKASRPNPAGLYADYQDPQSDQNEMPLGRIIVDLLWHLALVLGIAYLAIYALRAMMGRQVSLPGQKGKLKVLESAPLGPNRAVHLVRVGSKILVLGSTPEQITAIGEMDEADTADAPDASAQAFSTHLAEAIVGEKGGSLPEDFHGGIRHIWDRVQDIRGLHGRGPRV